MLNTVATVTDDVLLATVTARQPGAWAQFQVRFERLIAACVKKVLRAYGADSTTEDVEDMVSSVYLNLVKDDFKKLRSFDAGRGHKLSSWVGMIARNTTLDALRQRTPAADSIDDADACATVDAGATPAEALERAEQQRNLLRAIDALPASDRTFLAALYGDTTPEQIAAAEGISVATVYSRRSKIVAKLRALVA